MRNGDLARARSGIPLLAVALVLRRHRRGGADLSAAHRPHRRSGRHPLAGGEGRARTEARGSRGQVRHPARRRHRQLAGRAGDRALRQRAVPHVEAGRGGEEQRRPAAGGAERASRADRGRLWPRRHADRRAVEGHHHQRHHAAVQGGRFQRRRHARRRRHRHRADDGRLGMGGAARAAARSPARDRAAGLAADRGLLRVRHALRRLAGLPPVRQQRAARPSGQFGRRPVGRVLARGYSGGGSWGGGGGGFSGGGGSSGGGGASGGW